MLVLAPGLGPESQRLGPGPELVLELAQWGVRDAQQLSWLDPPPAAAKAQAREG